MKAGKLKESVLKRSVLKQLHTRKEEVLVKPAVGGDYGAVEVSENLAVVLSSDPVTISREEIGSSAIMAACNDVACSGATLKGVSVTMLLPTTFNEDELRDLMKDMDQACQECGVDILSGHTEVTRVVKEPVVVVTAMGIVEKEALVHSSGVQPGMDIVATKWVGLEGTAILAREREEELRTRYAKPFIDNAKVFGQMMSIVPEAAVAIKSGASAMHDVSEGGIFGALWELAESAGVGLEIDLKKIPIRQETVEICEFFDLNPYKIVSGGCLLIATTDGNGMVLELEKVGIPATVIGKATDGNDRVLLNEDERRFLETTQTDELYNLQ
ncbi:MAG: hydrogenase maturation factor [Lachnospiraceae bacterium]|nr:hydrogenase maturation factor [Lachnospiraceae bacterium]